MTILFVFTRMMNIWNQQSQSAMFGSMTHMTILFVFSRANGINQKITTPTKNGHGPPHWKRIFSLLSSLFYSLVFFSFVSSSLFVSLCLSPCGAVVLLFWCGVVCDTLKTPCMPAPRAHVFSTCARGAGIHGDFFECIPDGGRRGEGKGVVVSLVFFIGKTSVFPNFKSTLTGR